MGKKTQPTKRKVFPKSTLLEQHTMWITAQSYPPPSWMQSCRNSNHCVLCWAEGQLRQSPLILPLLWPIGRALAKYLLRSVWTRTAGSGLGRGIRFRCCYLTHPLSKPDQPTPPPIPSSLFHWLSCSGKKQKKRGQRQEGALVLPAVCWLAWCQSAFYNWHWLIYGSQH